MQIQVKVENKKVIMSLEKLGDAVPRTTNAAILGVMNAALLELREPGSEIAYPVKWDSERQRRAYFATDGFGAGIPYRRTGRYNKGWVVTKTGSGLVRAYTISNKWAKAKYVGGNSRGGGQSRIHRGRWAVAAEIIRKHSQEMLVNVDRAVKSAIRESGMGL